MKPVAEAVKLSRDYRLGAEAVHALNQVSFTVVAGELVCVMGPSGSGKSTLLHLLGGLDRPTSGEVLIEGNDLARLDDEQLTALRRERLGFIFQFFNLLPTMKAWENVALPRLLAGERLSDARPRANELLERVGLEARTEHKPAQLSGGEMQRVAVARSLIGYPALVLADEPTGNLDSRSGSDVLALLRSLVDDDGMTLIMVTHDQRGADAADRVLTLSDGRLQDGTAI